MTWPLAIGGVGGSGTRAVAEIVSALGVHLGTDLNGAGDNLRFPGLARFVPPGTGDWTPILHDEEIEEFAEHMLESWVASGKPGWGWKIPPTFFFLEQLALRFPEMRYLHVMRHGLDMAFSANRNQVRQWGHLFGITEGRPTVPEATLHYWIEANRHAIDVAHRVLGPERTLTLDFDAMCAEPQGTLTRLSEWVGGGIPDDLSELTNLVRTPSSTGRYRDRSDPDTFHPEDLEAVRAFGFIVEW